MPVQMTTPPHRKQKASQKDSSRQGRQPSYTSKWEWVAAALGLVLVVGMLGSIGYYGLTTSGSVPAVSIEHAGTESIPGGYVVRFRALNSSSSTAAALHIAGELREGGEVVESGQAVVDYLPGHSERQGGLFFRQDPNRYELRLYPLGYVEP
jgi:uncharacterized protein (TIGR02588 family)